MRLPVRRLPGAVVEPILAAVASIADSARPVNPMPVSDQKRAAGDAGGAAPVSGW